MQPTFLTHHTARWRSGPAQWPGEREFVALVALLMALNALSIDIVLPALGLIADDLRLADANNAQWVVSAYIFAFGLGQLVIGPLSDQFGRRTLLMLALCGYVLANVLAASAPGFATLIAARVVQGLTAAGLRICVVSTVRDRFSGRAMARVMSLAMMVFMAAPLFAPALGQGVLLVVGDWHWLFVVVALVGALVTVWTFLRLPESLPQDKRRHLDPAHLMEGYGLILRNRCAWGYMVASGFVFGALFSFIVSSNQILLDVYDVGALFPLAFAAVASGMILSNFANATLVERFGMRALSHTALIAFLAVNALHALIALTGLHSLPVFLALTCIMIALLGFLGANFTALSLEPVGQIAGLASSVQGFISTGVAGVLGQLVGLQFNGTATPFAMGILILSVAALVTVLWTEGGRLRAFDWSGEHGG